MFFTWSNSMEARYFMVHLLLVVMCACLSIQQPQEDAVMQGPCTTDAVMVGCSHPPPSALTESDESVLWAVLLFSFLLQPCGEECLCKKPQKPLTPTALSIGPTKVSVAMASVFCVCLRAKLVVCVFELSRRNLCCGFFFSCFYFFFKVVVGFWKMSVTTYCDAASQVSLLR